MTPADKLAEDTRSAEQALEKATAKATARRDAAADLYQKDLARALARHDTAVAAAEADRLAAVTEATSARDAAAARFKKEFDDAARQQYASPKTIVTEAADGKLWLRDPSWREPHALCTPVGGDLYRIDGPGGAQFVGGGILVARAALWDTLRRDDDLAAT